MLFCSAMVGLVDDGYQPEPFLFLFPFLVVVGIVLIIMLAFFVSSSYIWT